MAQAARYCYDARRMALRFTACQGNLHAAAFFSAFFLLLCHANLLAAAAHIPTSDSIVLELERLPFKSNDPVARELAQLRAQLQRSPCNLEVALQLAQRYYALVGAEGDQRYLGYAQAALAGPLLITLLAGIWLAERLFDFKLLGF